MEQYPFPLNSFVTTSNATLQTVLETEADFEVGYIVKVDIEYSQDIHVAHSDFKLAPTKEVIKEEWLSNDQRKFPLEKKFRCNGKSKIYFKQCIQKIITHCVI